MWVALYVSGFTVAEIAQEFDVSRQAVNKSINRLLDPTKLQLKHKLALAQRQHDEHHIES